MKTRIITFIALTSVAALVACGGSTPEPEMPDTEAAEPEMSEPDMPAEAGEAADAVDEPEAEPEAADEVAEEDGAEEADEDKPKKKSLKAMKGNRMEKADAEE